MSFTNFILGGNWNGEWPEFIEVGHEGQTDYRRYVPEAFNPKWDRFDTFCPECDREVEAYLERRPESRIANDIEITYEATVAICPICHTVIGDSRVEESNDEVFAEARRAKDLL